MSEQGHAFVAPRPTRRYRLKLWAQRHAPKWYVKWRLRNWNEIGWTEDD